LKPQVSVTINLRIPLEFVKEKVRKPSSRYFGQSPLGKEERIEGTIGPYLFSSSYLQISNGTYPSAPYSPSSGSTLSWNVINPKSVEEVKNPSSRYFGKIREDDPFGEWKFTY